MTAHACDRDPLPAATRDHSDRDVVEFLTELHLQESGEDSLVARTWQWVLHGDGPPSRATLSAESHASRPPLHPHIPWDELNRARFICWLCTSQPEDELPLRFRTWDARPAPIASEEGSVTISIHEIQDG